MPSTEKLVQYISVPMSSCHCNLSHHNCLNELATTEIESHIYAEYNEQYQGFIIIALLILIIDFFILNRKNKRLSKINLFKEYNK